MDFIRWKIYIHTVPYIYRNKSGEAKIKSIFITILELTCKRKRSAEKDYPG